MIERSRLTQPAVVKTSPTPASAQDAPEMQAITGVLPGGYRFAPPPSQNPAATAATLTRQPASERQQTLLHLQTTHGNRYVQRVIAHLTVPPAHARPGVIQRDPPPRPRRPQAPAGQPAAAPAPSGDTARQAILRPALAAIRARFGGLAGTLPNAGDASFTSRFHILSDQDFEREYQRQHPPPAPGSPEAADYAPAREVHGMQTRGSDNRDVVTLRAAPPGSMPFRVTVVHEILHTLERLGGSRGPFVEAATQYLAIYAVHGSVNAALINQARAYRASTTMLLTLLNGVPGLTTSVLAGAYFSGDLSPLQAAVNTRLHSVQGWAVVMYCFSRDPAGLAGRVGLDSSMRGQDASGVELLRGLLSGRYRLIPQLNGTARIALGQSNR